MRRRIGAMLLAGLGLAVLLSLWGTPLPFLELLKQPLQSLWGSHQRLRSGVLEVSENIESIQAATRQLLKPFGGVRLIRRFPAKDPSRSKNF